MADEIIDLTRYIKREPASDLPRGSMALWGADGERSGFVLPLWRIIHLSQAERGLILWSSTKDPGATAAFVALDLAADPARTEVDTARLPRFGPEDGPSLVDLEADGLVLFLGANDGRIWTLYVDGGTTRTTTLPSTARDDILFLAGECAGLLFLRGLASEVPEGG